MFFFEIHLKEKQKILFENLIEKKSRLLKQSSSYSE